MRRFAHCRVDKNHLAVRDYLRKLGWSAESLAPMGGGWPDLLVGKPGYSALVEIKKDAKEKLTPKQQEFVGKWTGPLIVAVSGEDAAAQLLMLWKGWA